ncbi:fasciclin domain-containing protein [Leptothoe kymatousa]|uniref:Fasciclin domain-containing protein n=1 Tax=Leptothoe kymatousa TAU-MAC 1615 TaxID=2364775 RepID=A0ABS5Y4R8_9CYAN|nr:fasciclin domain-containing protein [Leptothoe kymatousa]MBT9312616.1 fasciclin domain-containing protein [Leptothoe kymatousa TAU-MAC 1615]
MTTNSLTTIADIVVQSGGEFDHNNQDFDILLQALQTANLTNVVADPNADLTVFAPTDAAFIQLAQDLGFEGSDEAGAFNAIVGTLTDLGNGDPIPVLQAVLQYHVSADAKTLEDIQAADSISTLLDGATLTPNGNSLIDNEPDIVDPSFIEALTDIQTDNGIIQGIDRVLIPLDIPGNGPAPSPALPATIADVVAQSGGTFDDNNQDFDILLTALETAGLTAAVADPNADLTVFAPTDAAFIQLAQDLGFEGSDEPGAFNAIVGALTELGEGDPIPVLQAVLQYHVSAGAKTLEDIQIADSISTLLDGATLTPNGNFLIDNEPDIIDPKFVDALTDVQTGNGIIQGIDRVLIPLDIPGNELNVVPGTNGNDHLLGTDSSDRLVGFAGIDRLVGGGGDDIFVLGDAHGSFYAEHEYLDFADIVDFQAGADIIQLSGSMGDYTFKAVNGGTWIFAGNESKGELVADVFNASVDDVTASIQFV